ncbi:MAG: oxidoreductase, partial [Armatimonadota bacterium]
MERLRIGIVGAGNISGIYLRNLNLFPSTRVVGLADLDAQRAEAIAGDHPGVQPMTTDALINNRDVDLVLNLTIPSAHADISKRALSAGKHVYSEKPVSIQLSDAEDLVAIAKTNKLLVGCAPDTFLGAGHQASRSAIEEGAIGVPVLVHGFMMYSGPEKWHPSPEFFYKEGAGPLLDMGPYYLTAFVNYFGPIKSVSSVTRTTHSEREITSKPLMGRKITVETPTSIIAILEFHSGMIGQLTTSFDTAGSFPNITIFGDEGELQVPDPNVFSSPVLLKKGESKTLGNTLPFAGNARGIGVVDMAFAIKERRPVRASGELALHVLEAMLGILESGKNGVRYVLKTR